MISQKFLLQFVICRPSLKYKNITFGARQYGIGWIETRSKERRLQGKRGELIRICIFKISNDEWNEMR